MQNVNINNVNGINVNAIVGNDNGIINDAIFADNNNGNDINKKVKYRVLS